MTFYFNLLKDTKTVDISVRHLRGLIGEEIAAYILRKKLNLLVIRPTKLISSMEAVDLKNHQYKFLVKHAKTMDFFGIWPSSVDLSNDHSGTENLRTSALDLFTLGSLVRSLAAESSLILKGFVIEVKSSMQDNQSRPKISPRQLKMTKMSKKMGFSTILAQVVFLPNYETRVRFFDEKGTPIDASKFAIP